MHLINVSNVLLFIKVRFPAFVGIVGHHRNLHSKIIKKGQFRISISTKVN